MSFSNLLTSQILQQFWREQIASRLLAFWQLTKPRVVSLIVFTAFIGMLLAVPGLPNLSLVFWSVIGIAFVAGSAAAINCLVEAKIDAVMRRTQWRPLPSGRLSQQETLIFALLVGGSGLWILGAFVNLLTMWLTLATFVGYAVIYTVLLKPMTPQNIVIGGASGAMPPVLGWVAMTGDVHAHALILFLIIFAWTPPHFWALALYRREEYARSGLPMLPITHGEKFTRLHMLLYTIILGAISLLPFASQLSGWIYLIAAIILNGIFIVRAVQLYQNYSDARSRKLFGYSIWYLSLIFTALLIDHYTLFFAY